MSIRISTGANISAPVDILMLCEAFAIIVAMFQMLDNMINL